MGLAEAASAMAGNEIRRMVYDVDIDDFTDNLDATGYIDSLVDLPVGALVHGWTFEVTEVFEGGAAANPLCVLGVAGTLNCFSGTASMPLGAAIGEVVGGSHRASNAVGHTYTAARAARFTVTVGGSADFTDLTAGHGKMTIFYSVAAGH